jgi:putative FmdB family regulatory protein
MFCSPLTCEGGEMPTYDYACPACGIFEAFRPMAEYQEPHPCPGCGDQADRILLTVPAFANMDAGRRTAMATNESSANAPRRFTASSGHAPGCGCCSGAASGRTRRGKDGSKSFPAARPWMISH